ncbi:hypothetical protein POBR111598_09905 [Polynucleobacter brandtiae]
MTVLPEVVFVIAKVAALTAPLKVVPPELVMVRVPMSVPMVLETLTTPVVLIVRFDTPLFAVPATDDKLIALAMPVPNVRVAPSASVVAPRVMVPVEVPPMVEDPLIVVKAKAPLKVIVPVVLARETTPALTAPPKVAVPELVMVRLPMSVPIVVVTATTPIELITT